MTTNDNVNAAWDAAIEMTNHAAGGGIEGYKALLHRVLISAWSDHPEAAVARIMRELGWEQIDSR